MLEWQTVPAIVRKDLSEAQAAKLQLIENIVRRDLDPVEEARAFSKMLGEDYTMQELSEAVGKPPGHITKCIQMLNASEQILHLVTTGEVNSLTAHALSKLSEHGQTQALGVILRKRLNYFEAVQVCDRIASEDSILELFGGFQLDAQQQQSVAIFEDTLRGICVALGKVEDMDRETPGSLASGLANPVVVEAQIDEVVRGLNQIKKMLNSRKIDQMVGEAIAAD